MDKQLCECTSLYSQGDCKPVAFLKTSSPQMQSGSNFPFHANCCFGKNSQGKVSTTCNYRRLQEFPQEKKNIGSKKHFKSAGQRSTIACSMFLTSAYFYKDIHLYYADWILLSFNVALPFLALSLSPIFFSSSSSSTALPSGRLVEPFPSVAPLSMLTQYVCISPLPFARTLSFRNSSQ